MNFKDAVREGDGEHVLLLWKFMLLVFKATGRKNYALEALTLLSQYYILLPPNLAEQLKWSRFINIHGCPGSSGWQRQLAYFLKLQNLLILRLVYCKTGNVNEQVMLTNLTSGMGSLLFLPRQHLYPSKPLLLLN